ncbi:MAG: S1 RNA-binding domain-containing protein, partial [Candidatus Marinimicrobia bacterium]|nr:S1 RNA-binding domain-containing protein [Candidatus Neomarinimicrobiota bacterium]
MTEEEKTITTNPSEVLEETPAEAETLVEPEKPVESENQEETETPKEPETPEEPEVPVAAESTVKESSEESPVEETTSEMYKTEIVSSGPLSEEIKVFEMKDIIKIKEESLEDQTKIYESSLKDISQEQRVIGTVVSINDDEILMDVGFKSEGIINRDEFEEGEIPKIGDQIEVFVDVLEDENGQMILSKRKADFMRVWERVRDIHNNSETIEGRITNRIKGGMVVDIMGIDAFLPGSQIDVRPVTDFDSYVGKSFDFRIVKLNELRKNIVISRKDLLEESLKEKRDDLLSKIKVGDVLKGRIKNITDFGVFIDLGGLDGLLHITDLSW